MARRQGSNSKETRWWRLLFWLFSGVIVLTIGLAIAVFSWTKNDLENRVSVFDYQVAFKLINKISKAAASATTPEEQARLSLSPEEVNSLIRLGKSYYFLLNPGEAEKGKWLLSYQNGNFTLKAQRTMDYGLFVNLEAVGRWEFSDSNNRLLICRVKLGALPIPKWAVERQVTQSMDDAGAVCEVLQRVIVKTDYKSNGMEIIYRPYALKPYRKYMRFSF